MTTRALHGNICAIFSILFLLVFSLEAIAQDNTDDLKMYTKRTPLDGKGFFFRVMKKS
jgi:hypothetical protein